MNRGLWSVFEFYAFVQCISIYLFLCVLFRAFKTFFPLEEKLRFHQMAKGICDIRKKKKAALKARIPSDSFLHTLQKQAGRYWVLAWINAQLHLVTTWKKRELQLSYPKSSSIPCCNRVASKSLAPETGRPRFPLRSVILGLLYNLIECCFLNHKEE